MSTTFVVADILADGAALTNSPPFATSTRVTLAQATYWLTQGIRAYSALISQHFPECRDLVLESTLVTTPSQNYLAHPDGAGQVHSVIWQRAAKESVLLRAAQQDDVELRAAVDWRQDGDPAWRLEGDAVVFYPPSLTAETIVLLYTVQMPQVFGSLIGGRLDADRWLTLDLAIKVQTAKAKSTAQFDQQKALLENDLLSKARERDANSTHTIRDVRGAAAGRYYRSRWGG